MPSLLAEDALHGTRKPCSRTLKALFLHQARPFDEKRGVWQLKYLDNPYWMFSVLLIQRVRSISHRKTQMNRTHRGQKNSGPSPGPSWPLPLPLPKREGRNHRDTPMANHQHLTTITQHPSLAVTLCELCMPKAFCGLETVRKNAQWTLCALWEKKLPSVLFVCCIIQWVLSISHRRTQKNRTHSIPQRH